MGTVKGNSVLIIFLWFILLKLFLIYQFYCIIFFVLFLLYYFDIIIFIELF